ncbi:succinate dehydrogenase, cytochrome b556 subunit [Chitinimonas sp. BJB300]|uniref:succinate dehydrogenase, cytochrome b556 subunit n=1 Tax=Chitinimonas sp. BJB300 TaxID=1559339 RepID=UPI000C0EC02F|nr:succinate dehydrogenase, cytochrome b556 subunit [Chitinimonas sp. BJB300]PHV13272.1 succinate dehydrogenase, cytochrome b556 subunit [Chitinimonas sp. BJB300]TSJ86024.1 succinate dehydrogenase, cytochrome b556 subunit [Chitinimonas sp. BJB300]
MEKTRPKHLDLPKIRLPIPGIVSILHRVSGALMFLAIPVVFWLLAGSLSSEAEFDAYRAFVAHPIIKLGLLALLWAYLHHACAGIRFLLLDIHKGLELSTARATAQAVMVVSLVLTAVIGGVLW